MKVESAQTRNDMPLHTATPSLGEGASGSFEAVLDGADGGAKSAAKAEEFSKLQDSFYEWRGGLDTTHPLNLPRFDDVTAASESFLNIVEKAVGEDGYSDPVGFLNGLSGSELETLRVMHSLADPIVPEGLSEEGAVNLILPFNESRDVDNDGFVETGKAVMWSFPPKNAPQSVHDAWGKTTEGMSFGDKMMAEAMFMPAMIRADENGNVTELERSEANNPYARNGFSFQSFVEDRLESVEAFKYHMTGEQYAFQKGALTKFLEELSV